MHWVFDPSYSQLNETQPGVPIHWIAHSLYVDTLCWTVVISVPEHSKSARKLMQGQANTEYFFPIYSIQLNGEYFGGGRSILKNIKTWCFANWWGYFWILYHYTVRFHLRVFTWNVIGSYPKAFLVTIFTDMQLITIHKQSSDANLNEISKSGTRFYLGISQYQKLTSSESEARISNRSFWMSNPSMQMVSSLNPVCRLLISTSLCRI